MYNALTGQPKWSYDNPSFSDSIANDVAIDGNLVAVSVTRNIYDMPKVLVFDRSTGAIVNQVVTATGALNDGMKHQMDLSDGRIVVGSWGTTRPAGGFDLGDATVFDALTGSQLFALKRNGEADEDEFGFGVALGGNRLLVGAPGVNGFRGATYYYLIPEPRSVVLLLPTGLLALLRLRGAPRRPQT